MPARLVRVLPYVALLVVCALLYWAALQIDTRGAEGGRRIGPDFWPKTVIAIMALLCLYETVSRLLARTPSDAAPREVDESGHAGTGIDPAPAAQMTVGIPAPADEVAPAAPGHPHRLAAGVALVAGFAVAVDWLGFFTSTAAFLALFMRIGGYRRPLLAASIGLLGSFLLIVVFMRIAYISLPLGTGPFRALSLGILRLIGVT